MNGSQLHHLARRLRELALAVTSEGDEERVSAGELAIIEDVAAHPATAVGEIAARTGLAQSLVSRTVATMREADIFVATPDPADRRRSLVSIEPTARVQLFRARAEALLAELVALFDEPHPNGR